MGAGGAAPPVKSEDVMILIGSCIVLTMFFVQAWSVPVEIECEEFECETFEVKYDLSKGDEFTLEVLDGEIIPTVILPDGSSDFGKNQNNKQEIEWSLTWPQDDHEGIQESYVNLIPTKAGGTHVTGFRSGLSESVKEFADYRNLLPRGVKLSPEDVWLGLSYILSIRLEDPQFSGQTKERLSSRECATFVAGIAKNSFGLFLKTTSRISTLTFACKRASLALIA